MKRVQVVFFTVGLLLLLVAGFSYYSTEIFLKTAVTTMGTVVENRYENDSNISYGYIKFFTEDGSPTLLRSAVGSNPPAFKVGDKIEIYYDRENPENAKIHTFLELWAMPVWLGSFGALFTLVPSVIFYFGSRNKRKGEWLRTNGEQIKAKYTGVVVDESISYNGRNPYVVTAQWFNPRTNMIYIFKSHQLWYNPEEFIKEEVPVYIDRNNAAQYFVDLSFLPKVSQ